MSSIRIRQPFAASFAVLLLVTAYLGLSTHKIPQYGQSDKGLHFVTFFLLTTTCYFTPLDLPRRRTIYLTLLTTTLTLALGSEILQALLPNGRFFNPFDVLANVLGSGTALVLCSLYHKRMLERRRRNRHYDIVPGEEGGELDEMDDLGRAEAGLGEQETGTVGREEVVEAEVPKVNGGVKEVDVGEELDRWDENEEDWEEDVDGAGDDGNRDENGKKSVD